MFNFTTTNVINSNLDSSGKDLWTAKEGSLNILRVNNFKKENVEAVYKSKAYEAELEKVIIPLIPDNSVKAGDQLRLDIYVGLTQASQDSRYSNDMIYNGKAFSVEYIIKGSGNSIDKAATVKTLKNTIKKYQLLVYGDPQLDAVIDETNITLTAKTEFQRFKSVKVSKYTPNDKPYSEQYTSIWDLQDHPANITAGKEGFGTYTYLLHNLRLPTTEHAHYMAIGDVEMPVIGALYDQYTIKYCVKRGPLGLNGVGDQVTSVTNHVFFVRKDLSTFEDAIKTAFGGDFIEIAEGKGDAVVYELKKSAETQAVIED